MVESIIPEKPKIVIFVLGTTAVGKSKLSLDLAQRVQNLFECFLNQNSQMKGEIINADSM